MTIETQAIDQDKRLFQCGSQEAGAINMPYQIVKQMNVCRGYNGSWVRNSQWTDEVHEWIGETNVSGQPDCSKLWELHDWKHAGRWAIGVGVARGCTKCTCTPSSEKKIRRNLQGKF